MKTKRLISVSSLADLFQVSPGRIERAIRRARIKPSAFADRTPVFRVADIDRIAEVLFPDSCECATAQRESF